MIQIRNGKKVQKEKVYFPGYIMIQANLSGEIPHIIKSITNVIGFLGETKGGDPVPLRQSEVNRMLGKVDELSLEADQNVAIPFVLKLQKGFVYQTVPCFYSVLKGVETNSIWCWLKLSCVY